MPRVANQILEYIDVFCLIFYNEKTFVNSLTKSFFRDIIVGHFAWSHTVINVTDDVPAVYSCHTYNTEISY